MKNIMWSRKRKITYDQYKKLSIHNKYIDLTDPNIIQNKIRELKAYAKKIKSSNLDVLKQVSLELSELERAYEEIKLQNEKSKEVERLARKIKNRGSRIHKGMEEIADDRREKYEVTKQIITEGMSPKVAEMLEKYDKDHEKLINEKKKQMLT